MSRGNSPASHERREDTGADDPLKIIRRGTQAAKLTQGFGGGLQNGERAIFSVDVAFAGHSR